MSDSSQRACRRVDLDVAVDLQSDSTFYGLTSNIGMGGLFVATRDIRPVGERLTLRLTLPDEERPLTVDVVVRWIRENSALDRREGAIGMGAQFLGLTTEAFASITRFVEARDSLRHDEGDARERDAPTDRVHR
jgi:uncharacterized protein (TIGR02266 family)